MTAPIAAEPTGAAAAVRRFRLFAACYAAAVLVHQLAQGRLLVADATAPLTLAAGWVLLRPGSLLALAVMLALHLGTVAWEMPRVVNHWLLMGITSLGLLVALAPLARRENRMDPTRRLDEALAPVRAQLVLAYLWAAFHKLNTGFFEPASSCGVVHYHRLAESVPMLPSGAWTAWPSIVGTLAIELALPLMLCARRSRPAALALAWAFHLGLGWNTYYDFSWVALAYLVAFLPERAFAGWDRARAEHPRLRAAAAALARAARHRWAPLASALALLAGWGLAEASGASAPELRRASQHAGRVLFVPGWLLLGAIGLGVAWRARGGAPAPSSRSRPWRRPALWLAPALVALNGCSPYLGLKTEHSFAMFSNLRTEADEWNHLVVPRTARVFTFQDELVSLLLSSDPQLARVAKGRWRLVPFEIRRLTGTRPGAWVHYARDGRALEPTRVRDDPFLREPLDPWLAKLLIFRPLPRAGTPRCQH